MASLPNRLPGLDFGLGETADMLQGQVEAFAAERMRYCRSKIMLGMSVCSI